MFGTVSLPSSEFKRLLGSVPPSAECAVGSSAPSAPEFLDSLLCVGTFSLLPGVRWPSSAAADLLLASVLRSGPPVAPSTGTIRSRWWWLVSGATPLRYPSDVPSASLPALPPGCGQRLDYCDPDEFPSDGVFAVNNLGSMTIRKSFATFATKTQTSRSKENSMKLLNLRRINRRGTRIMNHRPPGLGPGAPSPLPIL